MYSFLKEDVLVKGKSSKIWRNESIYFECMKLRHYSL